MRVLVCGGRDFGDAPWLFRTLDDFNLKSRFSLLMHGAAKGADSLADNWARSRGVPVESYPADWLLHGRSAGPIRNRQMMLVGRPELVIAFPGGKGTDDMTKLAKKAGVPCCIVGKLEL